MSFTVDEVIKLKAVIAPKKSFKYSYKNHSCNIDRELTLEEFEEWKGRIDEAYP